MLISNRNLKKKKKAENLESSTEGEKLHSSTEHAVEVQQRAGSKKKVRENKGLRKPTHISAPCRSAA
jgi:hypothetical protein